MQSFLVPRVCERMSYHCAENMQENDNHFAQELGARAYLCARKVHAHERSLRLGRERTRAIIPPWELEFACIHQARDFQAHTKTLRKKTSMCKRNHARQNLQVYARSLFPNHFSAFVFISQKKGERTFYLGAQGLQAYDQTCLLWNSSARKIIALESTKSLGNYCAEKCTTCEIFVRRIERPRLNHCVTDRCKRAQSL